MIFNLTLSKRDVADVLQEEKSIYIQLYTYLFRVKEP